MFPPSAPTPTFPYRVLGKIGEGAMGAVYQAEDLELGRRVALKVIKPELLAALAPADAQDMAQRFLQEARAAAALTHPGATVVHRVGMEGRAPYIAMEWLDGRSLEALIAEKHRYPVEQVARLGLQVLSVLAAAHGAGIVHRDIKPANLMVTRDGRIKVTDFGIARVQGSSLAHTQAGMILGTPQYAAPEQLAGQAVDCRADLYALGGVLYEALVGRPPFEAPTLYELIHRVQTTMPAPPSRVIAGLPAAVDSVILRALAKRPDERFSTAQEMASALQAFLGGGPAHPVSAPTRSAAAPSSPADLGATLVRVPSLVVQGANPAAMVASLVRQWPATPVMRQTTAQLLERLLERPLHAAAFCGAVEVPGACLLVCDGIIYAAFDPASGRFGDEVIDALPATVDATLHAVPSGTEPRLVALLASLLLPPEPRLSGLDSSFTDLPQLAGKLGAEGFDGALRFARGGQLGFSLFSKGRRVLDLFSAGWPALAQARRWEEWISKSGAVASVEDRRVRFPSHTFRQQLRELELDVVRPAHRESGSLLSDSLAEAQALQLRPREKTKGQLRRGDSTLQALVDGDPAFALARWVLVDLAPQFEQYGRTARWKALVEPLSEVVEVRLHHSLPGVRSPAESFDAATYGKGGRLHHVIERASVGDRATVEAFVARVIAAREARSDAAELTGAILVAPHFTEDGLDAYLKALRSNEKRSVFSGLDAFTHKEGFLRLSARGGLHVLLVEDNAGRRRPLVPG
ncbi:MAG: protein kinase [Deltaproteobacteria bacterium]|nr:protein kinase [Deltaproteobacteria bacterium]